MELIITEANYETEVLGSKLPVLVDFYADWCGPCKMMAPVLETIAKEYEGKMKVGKCDVDENMILAQKNRVASIPNLILVKEGQVIGNYIGYMSKDELLEKIEADLNK